MEGPSSPWHMYGHIYIYMCVPRLCRSHRYKPVHIGMHIGVAMGYRIQGAGCSVQCAGCRLQCAEFRVQVAVCTYAWVRCRYRV